LNFLPSLSLIMQLIRTLLSSEGFIPHGHCYLWKPALVWLHIVSNGVIALAYFSIPVLLISFVSQRKDIPFNWVFLLFGAFIIACGSGHLMDIWTLWHPNYWLAGVLKAVTAIISLYTALELVPLLPKLLALPSPAQLEAANQELEQTLAKLQDAQTQLIHTEKMSGLGQLVAGIAHEINNPINFIYGNISHAKQYALDILEVLGTYEQAYPEPTPTVQAAREQVELAFVEQDLPKVLESIQLGADRIRKIVLSLRNFSRLDESEMKPVNIHEGIESTLLILQHRFKSTYGLNIQVRREYGTLPLVECYPGQLNQVFMNILSNAIDALEERFHRQMSMPVSAELPTITITTVVGENSPTDNPQVVVQIRDNGIGVPSQMSQTIFNPFFTTKPIGKGTGLGLSISRQIIVEKHGGQINCCSTPGKETIVSITIPVRQFKPGLVTA
jgi:two-component system NtrC family sensor kinase